MVRFAVILGSVPKGGSSNFLLQDDTTKLIIKTMIPAVNTEKENLLLDSTMIDHYHYRQVDYEEELILMFD